MELKRIKNEQLKEKLIYNRLVSKNKQLQGELVGPSNNKSRTMNTRNHFGAGAVPVPLDEIYCKPGYLLQTNTSFMKSQRNTVTGDFSSTIRDTTTFGRFKKLKQEPELRQRKHFDMNATYQTVKFSQGFSTLMPEQRPKMFRQLSNQRGELVGYISKFKEPDTASFLPGIK